MVKEQIYKGKSKEQIYKGKSKEQIYEGKSKEQIYEDLVAKAIELKEIKVLTEEERVAIDFMAGTKFAEQFVRKR